MPPVERKPPAPVRGADLRPPIKGMFMRFMHSMELPQLLAESYPPLWGGLGRVFRRVLKMVLKDTLLSVLPERLLIYKPQDY